MFDVMRVVLVMLWLFGIELTVYVTIILSVRLSDWWCTYVVQSLLSNLLWPTVYCAV